MNVSINIHVVFVFFLKYSDNQLNITLIKYMYNNKILSYKLATLDFKGNIVKNHANTQHLEKTVNLCVNAVQVKPVIMCTVAVQKIWVCFSNNNFDNYLTFDLVNQS